MSLLEPLARSLETHGEPVVLAAGGLAIGLLYGLCAQRSRFCTRAAFIETAEGRAGGKLAVWLLAFAVAIAAVQALVLAGGLDPRAARQMSGPASLSGALVGGVLFGVGMVLTRGCPARLLVLAGNGNLRAVVTGLVFAVTAQATLGGALAPARAAVNAWWGIDPGPGRSVLASLGLGPEAGLAAGLVLGAVAVACAARARLAGGWAWLGPVGVGLAVAATWGFSQWVVRQSFEPLQVHGLTFSAPAADWLLRVVQAPAPRVGFDAGLLPGVVLGAVVGGLIGREFKLEGFHDGLSMIRYGIGAMLMGFGAVAAGGCAVGAIVSGGAIFAVVAWLALGAMWVGATLAHRMLDAGAAGR